MAVLLLKKNAEFNFMHNHFELEKKVLLSALNYITNTIFKKIPSLADVSSNRM